jgi:Intron-binding protein aquarius N-terminus
MLQPIFGEETGELIDFRRWSVCCARMVGISIQEVAPPKMGTNVPQRVDAQLTINLKDLANPQLQSEWLSTLKSGVPLFLVGFEKDPLVKEASSFSQEFGLKLIRSVLVRPINN